MDDELGILVVELVFIDVLVEVNESLEDVDDIELYPNQWGEVVVDVVVLLVLVSELLPLTIES